MAKLTLVYVPGLGDRYDPIRKFCLWFWRFYGLRIVFVPMEWYLGGAYEDKSKLLADKIRGLVSTGGSVAVIGESAGASMVLTTCASSEIDIPIITLAGVCSPDFAIANRILERAPALRESQRLLGPSINKIDAKSTTNIQLFVDNVIPASVSRIAGGKAYVLPGFGHLLGILGCLTLLSPFVVFVIRRACK